MKAHKVRRMGPCKRDPENLLARLTVCQLLAPSAAEADLPSEGRGDLDRASPTAAGLGPRELVRERGAPNGAEAEGALERATELAGVVRAVLGAVSPAACRGLWPVAATAGAAAGAAKSGESMPRYGSMAAAAKSGEAGAP